MDIDKIIKAYLNTAVWVHTDGDMEHLPEGFTVEDFTTEAVNLARRDIVLFVEHAGELLDGLDPHMVGHNFWLTRNHEGAGFWCECDIPDKETRNTLTKLSHDFPEVHVISTGSALLLLEPNWMTGDM